MTKLLRKVEVVPTTQELEGEDLTPTVGQWYWIKRDDGRKLGCVNHIGSNFIQVTYVGKYAGTQRFHFDQFFDVFERENDPDAVIEGEIARCQDNVRQLMGRVTELTNRLAVAPRTQLAEPPPETMALSRISSGQNLEDYKTALVKAKEETLPELFAGIKEANEKMAVWMTAQTIPLKVMAEGMKQSIDRVDARIFNIELYAGLTETVGQFAEGEPAPADEKLHIMQRRCYMDEECLANYQAGGLEFKGIQEFDAWLAAPENRDRILPFPRCMVSFRVRRHRKNRHGHSLRDFIRIMGLEDADKSTFLYIRNGENLYWMQTKLDFGEKLFPDYERSTLNEDLMAKMFGGRVDELIPRRTYDQMVKDEETKKAAHEAENEAKKARGEKTWHYYSGLSSDRYEPFTPDSIYYDDMRARVAKEIAQYNRIALIIQGLFDRSPVFHPHPPVKTWSPEGFEKAIKLVFDSDYALYADEKPDFQAYFDRLNKMLKSGDVTIGQELAWMQKEAERENARIDRSWREHREYDHEVFRPYGNPGPGFLAVPTKLTKNYATYKWTRERLTRRYYDESEGVPATIRVSRKKLFNVSAYKPGDYKQFFADPRTRDEYIKWAPMLLSAEDYHAGKLKVGE